MSDPIRYSVEEINCCFEADMIENSAGDYVLYEDYALLQADVKALRTELADAQESNHILNETIAMMRKEAKQS